MNTLKLNEHDYRYLFENSNDAMWVHDMEGNFIDANKAFERLSGGTLEDWSHIKLTEHITKETLALSREVKRKLLNGEEFEQPYEQWFTTKDGRIRRFQVSTSTVVINGEVRGFQHIGRDVTEEKYAEEMLGKIIDGSPIPMFVINNKHIVTHWNTAIELLSGIKRETVIGTDKHWKSFYHRKRVTMADLVVDGDPASKINRIYHGSCRLSRLMNDSLDAESFFPNTEEGNKWFLFNACPIKNEAGEIVSAIETMQDISEQKKLEENIRYYSQLILRAQEDERLRIARELHDDTSSSMLLLIQRLDVLQSGCAEISDALAQKLENLREYAVEVLDGLRRCAQQLRPRILDDIGLIAAIEWLAEDMIRTHDIDTIVNVAGEECELSLEKQLLLFRIIQEALNNVRRHSEAAAAVIRIEYKNDYINVFVADNGKGFEPPEIFEDLASHGNLGIIGMSERAQLMHGNLEIQSKLGKGTKVSVKIPCKDDK